MSISVVIAGSGKMAKNIGSYLFNKGTSVTWLSKNSDRVKEMEGFAEKITRRLFRADPSALQKATACELDTYSDIPDIIIESTTEECTKKEALMRHLQQHCGPRTLLASNSSSIPPWELAPDAVGLHFFYPLELTSTVELIIGRTPTTPGVSRRLGALAENWDLQSIRTEGDRSFAPNRFLLPLQEKAVNLLFEGIDYADIDAASRCGMLPLGQLSLIKSIGTATVLQSVINYNRSFRQDSYIPLQEQLSLLEETSWEQPHRTDHHEQPTKEELEALFLQILTRRSREYLDNKILSYEELTIVFEYILQAEHPLETVLDNS